MSGGTFVGFTPAPDCIRDDIDALAALVFGAVYRFSQQGKGTCTASVESIAKRVGIGPTAARVRLGKLVEGGWLIALETPGRPTTYRDAGKWTVKIVGENDDSTPTRNVALPQRETGRSACTPTRNGGVPQREALPKILPKILEQDIAAGAAPASLMTNIPSAQAVTVSPPTPAEDDGRWDSTQSTFALDLEGRAAAWRSKTGRPLHPYGQLTGVIGGYCNDDPHTASVVWGRFVAQMKAAKMRDGRPVWSIIRKANVIEQVGRWLADGGADGTTAEDLGPGRYRDPVTGRLVVNAWVAR